MCRETAHGETTEMTWKELSGPDREHRTSSRGSCQSSEDELLGPPDCGGRLILLHCTAVFSDVCSFRNFRKDKLCPDRWRKGNQFHQDKRSCYHQARLCHCKSLRVSWRMSRNDTESCTCHPRTQHIKVFPYKAAGVPDFLYELQCGVGVGAGKPPS